MNHGNKPIVATLSSRLTSESTSCNPFYEHNDEECTRNFIV